MCYDLKVSLERQLKFAKHYGDQDVILEIEKNLFPLLNPIEREFYQVSGFEHPKMFVLLNERIEYAQWGLIPHWTRNQDEAKSICNKTLNARFESIREKPSFKSAFENGRGVLFVDGFYEHRHFNGRTYPYFIQRSDRKQMALGCIYDEWEGTLQEPKGSFSIVTTKANDLMQFIHNNPNIPEPRMPLILNDEKLELWMRNEQISESDQKGLFEPCASEILESHTVRPIKGKNVTKNSENAADLFLYPELGATLFD